MDNIMSKDLRDSLNIEENIHNIFNSGYGSGKSASFFFFSADKKFVVKTLRGQEKFVLLSIIDDMKNHFVEGKSLLAKIYGLYTIKTNKFSPVDIIIMQNTNKKVERKN